MCKQHDVFNYGGFPKAWGGISEDFRVPRGGGGVYRSPGEESTGGVAQKALPRKNLPG